MDTDTSYGGGLRLGWVQEQMLLTILDAYRAIEARNDPAEMAHLAAHGIPYVARSLVQAPGYADADAVVSHAARRLEKRHYIARSTLQRAGPTVSRRSVRLLPAGRERAEALAILREVSPSELAGPVHKPRQPDATTDTGALWHGLEPELAAQAHALLDALPPADTLALGMLLVRESIARGAGEVTHRATLSPQEVAALVKVSPALVYLEIAQGILPASKVAHTYRITPQDLQTWLERTRPDRRRRDQRES